MTPQISRVFFFFFFITVQVCQEREIFVVTEYLYRSHASIVCASQSCACLSCAPNSIMGDRASLLFKVESLYRALCLIVTSLPLAQCPFPVATQMNSVMTWDLITMTELYHDLKFSCRDLVSTLYASLCCNTEKSYCDMWLFATFALCRDTKKLCRDMGFSFMPVLSPSLSQQIILFRTRIPLSHTHLYRVSPNAYCVHLASFLETQHGATLSCAPAFRCPALSCVAELSIVAISIAT